MDIDELKKRIESGECVFCSNGKERAEVLIFLLSIFPLPISDNSRRKIQDENFQSEYMYPGLSIFSKEICCGSCEQDATITYESIAHLIHNGGEEQIEVADISDINALLGV